MEDFQISSYDYYLTLVNLFSEVQKRFDGELIVNFETNIETLTDFIFERINSVTKKMHHGEFFLADLEIPEADNFFPRFNADDLNQLTPQDYSQYWCTTNIDAKKTNSIQAVHLAYNKTEHLSSKNFFSGLIVEAIFCYQRPIIVLKPHEDDTFEYIQLLETLAQEVYECHYQKNFNVTTDLSFHIKAE